MRYIPYKKNVGNTLLETLFYISLLTAMSILIINSLVVMTKAFRETAVQRDFSQGVQIMEKISREIRLAKSINTISTTSLKLNTTDDAGGSLTKTFSLVDGDLKVYENDVLLDNLNSQNISINDLSFNEIDTTVGGAVKVSFGVNSKRDSQGREENFYDTIVLRGKY